MDHGFSNRPNSYQEYQEEISGFVMAGGRSSRLGQDKVLLPWNGGTLLDHAIQRLAQVCKTVGLCASRDDLEQHISPSGILKPPSLLLIRDALPDAGPLAGIVPALESSSTAWNFFLAVDLPLIPAAFLRALAIRTLDRANNGALAIIPTIDGIQQPLCGLYHRSLAAGLRAALEGGKYKLMLALREAVREIETGDTPSPQRASLLEFLNVRGLASIVTSNLLPEEWFLNVNTPQEWQRAVELSDRER